MTFLGTCCSIFLFVEIERFAMVVWGTRKWFFKRCVFHAQQGTGGSRISSVRDRRGN